MSTDIRLQTLKNLSTHNRQRILEIIGLDTELQQLLILKYCELLSRDEIANKTYMTVDSVDRKMAKAKARFLYILDNEYYLFTKEQQELLNLIQTKEEK